jgi:hypothetical protein
MLNQESFTNYNLPSKSIRKQHSKGLTKLKLVRAQLGLEYVSALQLRK